MSHIPAEAESVDESTGERAAADADSAIAVESTADSPAAPIASGSRTVAAEGFSEGLSEPPLTVIERKPGWKFIDFQELWKYRELLYFLVWRDVKVRYKQTALGAIWAVLQPLATMIVFAVIFGRVAGISTGDVPYPLFVFAGMLPWSFFSAAITSASGSVVGSANLVSKVYFPRLFIPLGAVGAGLVDFAVSFVMLLILMVWYQVAPGWGLMLIPALTLGLVVAALGVGVLLSALTVAYRDAKHAVPFMIQLWMFATPSIYLPADKIAQSRFADLMPLNPAYGLIANFRAAILGLPLDLYSLGVSTTVAAGLLVFGCLYFRKVERSFADII